MLKGQDILVLLKIANRSEAWTYQSLASELELSASEVHAALKRAELANLFDPQKRKVRAHALCQAVEYGVPYFLPGRRKARSVGIPTAYSAEPLNSKLIIDQDDVVVWPDPGGNAFGDALDPLYRSAPRAAKRDACLHRRLALVDAFRIGRARERTLAAAALRAELGI